MKQVRKNRLLAWVLACAMIAGLLPAVSVPVLAAEESHVHDPAALVNGVCSCGAVFEATLTIGDTTTCYEKLPDAVAAAENSSAAQPAVVKLQKSWQEIKGQGELPTYGVRIHTGVFTIDFNGCTVFSRAEHVFQIGDPAGEPCNAVVTFTDSSEAGTGRLTGTKNLCAIYNYGGSVTIEKLKIDVKHESSTSIAVHNELGNLTIHGGSFQVGGVLLEESYAVKMDSDTVNRINGGSFVGGANDLYVKGQLTFGLHPLTGVGASFPGGISVVHKTLNALLAADTAYWTADGKLTNLANEATAIDNLGDVTVKTVCDHSANTNTRYQADPFGTHSLNCSVCGYYADSQPHSGGAATCLTKAVCATCGVEYGEPLGHNYGSAVFTWAQDYSTATAKITCSRCDEDTAGHTLSADAVVTLGSVVEGTCKTKESKTYIATVTLNGQEYKEEKTVVGQYGDHDYVDGVCEHCGGAEPAQPTEPAPTEPAPTDPQPTEPAPTEPAPTDPQPTEPEEPSDADVIRLSGQDRYLTGFAVADQLKKSLGVEKFEAVVVAYGQNFPDALTGSYLAAVKHAPILLTEESKDAYVLDYVHRNLVSGGKVYILGGTAAVSEDFEKGAAEFGFQVIRLKGANRYETNLAILEEAGVFGDDEILIATGKNYADSLSASATGLPMLLVEDNLTPAQKTFLEDTSCRFVILGGSGAVSDAVEAELKTMGTVTRVKGSSRYGTSVAIAQRYFENPQAVVLAYGQGFPDGLCGGPLAITMGAPLVLTSDDQFDLADTYVVNISAGVVTGGAARISDATVRAIFDLSEDALIPKA